MRPLLLHIAWVCLAISAALEISGILRRVNQPKRVTFHLAALIGFSSAWLLLSYAVPLWVHYDSVDHLVSPDAVYKGESSRALLSLVVGSSASSHEAIVHLFRAALLVVPFAAYALALLLTTPSASQRPIHASAESASPDSLRPAFVAALLLVAQPQWFLPLVNVEYFALFGACVALLLIGVHGFMTGRSVSAVVLVFSTLVLIGFMRPESVVIALAILVLIIIAAFRDRRPVVGWVGLALAVLLADRAAGAIPYIMNQARTEPLSMGTSRRHDLGGQPWYQLLAAWASNAARFFPKNLLYLLLFQHFLLLGGLWGGAQRVRARPLGLPPLVALVFPAFYLTIVLGKDIGFDEPVKYHALIVVALWFIALSHVRPRWENLPVRLMTYGAVAMTVLSWSIPLLQVR